MALLRETIETLTVEQARLALRRMIAYGYHKEVRDAITWARKVDYYEIQATDVGKPTVRAFGRVCMVSGFLGRILPNDVGKRVYQRSGVLQVENDEQRDRRVHGAG